MGFQNKISWKIYTLIVCLFTSLMGTLWFVYTRHHVHTNDAYLDGFQVAISSDIEGRIVQLFVDEGQYVKEGQLLCQLDESILKAKKLEEEATVVLLKKQKELQKILLEKQKDTYEVAKKEVEQSIISSLDFDHIEKDFLAQKASLEVAKAALAQGIASLGKTNELLSGHTKIFAPKQGAIAKRWVSTGDVVQIGQPIFSLTEPTLWITANFEETKIGRIQKKDRVKIRIDAYPHLSLTGSVEAVYASAASRFALIPPNNATGNFTKVVQRVPVRISLDTPTIAENFHLYPGMSVEVSIHAR